MQEHIIPQKIINNKDLTVFIIIVFFMANIILNETNTKTEQEIIYPNNIVVPIRL